MAPTTAHQRAQINRWVRIAAAISVAGPVISELLHPWILRYPAIGVFVGAVEVLWRALYPAMPVRSVLTRFPRPSSPPDNTYGGPP